MEVEKNTRKPIPDGGYGWVVLTASFFISFFLDGIMYTFNMLLLPMQEHFNVGEVQGNLIISLNTGFLFCSGPLVAGLTNTFGCRATIMVGGTVTAILYMMCVFAANIEMIWLFYGVLGGVSTGCTYISSLIVIAEYFDKRVGTATGIVMAGSGLGSTIMPHYLEQMLHKNDWKLTMAVLAILVAICVGLAAFLKPLNPKSAAKPTKKQIQLSEIANSEETTELNPEVHIQTFMGSVYSLHRDQQPFYKKNKFCQISLEIVKEMIDFKLLTQNIAFALIVASNFFIFSGFFLTYNYMGRSATKYAGMENIKYLLMLVGVLNVPFRLLFGLIADRRYLTPLNLNTLCVFIPIIPYFIYKEVLCSHVWGQYMFATFFAIGTAGVNSLTTAYLIDMVGVEDFGKATGIVNMFRGFGCIIGPIIGGIIAEREPTPNTDVFYFSGLCFLMGLTFSFLSGFWVTVKQCFNKNRKPANVTINMAPDQNNNKIESGTNKNFITHH